MKLLFKKLLKLRILFY